MDDDDKQFFYHPLENIEHLDVFYEAVKRDRLTTAISPERPYTYWTIELYDQKNGIRGGGGLGILAADTRRIAETLEIPLVLITPFYPIEVSQTLKNQEIIDRRRKINYLDFGFKLVDQVYIKCNGILSCLDVIEKTFSHTKIIAITEPNLGELYGGLSDSDHRLYQEVALGFGGYAALKLTGLKPSIMQLNEVATFFAALARLDELASNGMDFYEAVVYTRKHTLYTNHTLVQAAEAEYSYEQFEKFVLPNLKSLAVKKWLIDKFTDGRIKLSSVTIEIAELRSGVSKLHTRVAHYRDVAGNKVKFKPITNGIDLGNWVLPETLAFYQQQQILDKQNDFLPDFSERLEVFTSEKIRQFKKLGRRYLNNVLAHKPDQNGRFLQFDENAIIFAFKRRFVDYKRPDLPFREPMRLKNILEKSRAHYVLTGRVHTGDQKMADKLREILEIIEQDDYLREHVHYLPNYDEELAHALACGANAAINLPIVGLEACGTSWMKDVANLTTLISTHDGGVADGSINAYLNVSGRDEQEELDLLYQRMEEAILIWENDFDLEFTIQKQLKTFLPIVSGARMLKDYLDYLYPK